MNIGLYTYWFTWKQRPHHFASAASDLGHTVDLFSARSIRDYLRGAKTRYLPHSGEVHYKSIRPVFPTSVSSGARALAYFDSVQRRQLIRRYCDHPADVHVYAAIPAELIVSKPPYLIYDCLDDWGDFPGLPQSVRATEQQLCQMADRIWVVSEHIYRKLAPEFEAKLEYVPNGVDYEHFADVPNMRTQHRRPVLGYVGALHQWFDANMVAAVADTLPDWDVTLVGPVALTADQRRVLDRPNVSFLGRHPYESLPGILAGFDVAMIPFIQSDLVNATSPIKLYEYLAAGLPVVSTTLPEVQAFEDDGIVACVQDALSFREAVLKLFGSEQHSLITRRQAIAHQHTWRARFEKALANVHCPGS